MRYPDYLTVGRPCGLLEVRMAGPGHGDAHAAHHHLANGRVATRTWDTGVGNEFPFINPAKVSKRQRYTWFLCNPPDRPIGLQRQLARFDTETGTVTRHVFGPDGYPGEPCFIATPESGAEDDGVVVTLVFDARRKRTDVVGLDARDVMGKPLFTGRLKHHVPFCLHGAFVPGLL